MKKNTKNKTKVVKLFNITLIALMLNGCLASESAKSVISSNDNSSTAAPETPTENPAPPITNSDYSENIQTMAAKSACAQVNWTDRGRAPVAYVKGMALSYARSFCRINASPVQAGASILKSANTENATKDVLAHYDDILANAGLETDTTGIEPLHATYVIGMGLGMKESSGRYCVGWDTAAGSDRGSEEAEAGLFQASYNSMSASIELRKIYDEYKANESRCLLEVYKQGVTCTPQSILGTGAGADYQAFTKRCPAFAAEYTMTLIRILRAHFGPLNRQTAQVSPVCDEMFTQVQKIVEANPEAACAELF
jgi:hypothetical protein